MLDFDLVPAEVVRPDHGNRFRVAFRFPTPRATANVEVLWKLQPIARFVVPVLTADEFLNGLTLATPTIAVRLGEQIVPGQLFVSDARGLLASAVLRGSHALDPLADLTLSVVFRSERTGRTREVAIALSAEQRGSTQAVIAAECHTVFRRTGAWVVRWLIQGRELSTRRVEVISTQRFEDSVHLVDARFAIEEKNGSVRAVRQLPVATTVERLGPCFLIASRESGAAGLCRLTVFATFPGEDPPNLLIAQDVLVTDAPTVFAPGLFATAELVRMGGFELRLNDRVLGTASLSPVPPATLTAEGGFKPPPGFTWTAAAEEELMNRLGRLRKPLG